MNQPGQNKTLSDSPSPRLVVAKDPVPATGFQGRKFLPTANYDLAGTLDSGQAFRWQQYDEAWEGVIGSYFVRLRPTGGGIQAETATATADWGWLEEFLQSKTDLAAVLKTFPADAPMTAAVESCNGLRLLRQDPWECLASFILSSTKQIVQIRQIISLLCSRYGEPITVPDGMSPVFAFPSPAKIASATEDELRACKMGFRAPGLLLAAQRIDGGQFDLESLRKMSHAEARQKLMTLHGVGAKIADCVLLFAYGFDSAFPLDVWVKRALQQLYFPRRRASEKRLQRFSATYFGPHAGYAQQYLFHYMRTKRKSG